MRTHFILLILLCVLASSANAAEYRFYIAPTATGTQDAGSWANASSDLYSVLDKLRPQAGNSYEIWVAKGTYSPPNTLKEYSFNLRKMVKLYGGFKGDETLLVSRDVKQNETILDGKKFNYRVITGGSNANSDDTRLDGFTITGGNATGTGDFANGGGMVNSVSHPLVANCTFVFNHANAYGGGVYNDNSSPLFVNCSFISNDAGSGGGMYNRESSPLVLNSSFYDNKAVNSGGAIYNKATSKQPPHAVIINGTFGKNTASNALSYGGAVTNDPASIIIVNNTFFENRTPDGKGAFYNNSSSSILAVNTIFWGGKTEINNAGGGTARVISCVLSQDESPLIVTENVISSDPVLMPFDARGGYYPLSSDSPAIKRGEIVGAVISGEILVPSFDQRMAERPLGVSSDIGAYQREQAETPPIDPEPDPDPKPEPDIPPDDPVEPPQPQPEPDPLPDEPPVDPVEPQPGPTPSPDEPTGCYTGGSCLLLIPLLFRLHRRGRENKGSAGD